MRQLSFTLEDSLLQRFPDFRDMVKASVYDCGRQFKAVAADLDLSVSELSRMLAHNPADPRNFPLDRLPELIQATGDKRPVLWLVESFLDDPAARRQHAVDRIDKLLPELAALVKEARAGETAAGQAAAHVAATAHAAAHPTNTNPNLRLTKG